MATFKRSILTSDPLAPEFHYPDIIAGTFDHDPHHPNFIVDPVCGAYLRFEDADCPLKKIHFHYPAEHRINGEQADFEAHLLHAIPTFPDTSSSVFVVVGVFFDFPWLRKHSEARSAKAKKSKPFEAFVKGVPFGPNSMSKALFALHVAPGERGTYTIESRHLLPAEDQRYDCYRYEGSLTSPAFAEFVSWIVLSEHAIMDDVGEFEIEENTEQEARECQPLNRRFVLRNFE